jgi:hypothetical protein
MGRGINMKTKKQIKDFLYSFIHDNNFEKHFECGSGDIYESVYIGSYMDLDPCKKYHSFASPNGVTKECERFWNLLEEYANEVNCWIENGEGDPTDIFLCRWKKEENK